MGNDEDKYKQFEEEREKYNNAILNSDASKKVIIAGPGTGKSYLFKKICEKNLEKGKTKNLVLSFINELVDDLAKELYQIAEVKTLHSFALNKFPERNARFFLNLEIVIEEDYKIINKREVDFKYIFCNLIENNDYLNFYTRRRKYYNFFSINCSVYSLIKYFEKNKDKIPSFHQILIDEFQDFNKLETRFIELLSEKSPILIVGDDDQSLYKFKHANPNEIRLKNRSQEYLSFELPYCSRCTKVIINSFNNIIREAKKRGFLINREEKRFEYFPSIEKDSISNQNPKIIVKKQVYEKTILPFSIEKEIKKIYDAGDKDATILIICPIGKQIKRLENALRKKGLRNIHTPQKTEEKELMEGFNLLLYDKDCNLGWRIVAKYIFKDKFKEIIKRSYDENEKIKFNDLLKVEDRKYIKYILAIIRKIKNNKAIIEEEYNEIIKSLNLNPGNITIQRLKNILKKDIVQKKVYKDVPVRITTILGSKGLTSDYVFLANFDDKYLLEEERVTDDNICKFLVALTRARKKLYIYTNENTVPTFVAWLGKENIELE